MRRRERVERIDTQIEAVKERVRGEEGAVI